MLYILGVRASLTTSWFQNKYSFQDFTKYNPPSLERFENGINITSPAKINLYLKIKPLYETYRYSDYELRHKNEFHHIETVYAGITLADNIQLYIKKEKGFSLYCNVKELYCKSNILVRILKELFKRYNIKNTGLKIILFKNIPVGGGLGGESSNIAFTYLAFHRLFNIPFNIKDAKEFVTKFSTDAIFFLYGGIKFGIGLPDKIELVNLDNFIKERNLFYPEKKFNRKYVLLIYPFLKTSSKKMYREFDKHPHLVREKPTAFFYNDFEKILCMKYKKIKIILDKIRYYGYAGISGVSGSGSTIFVLLKNKKEVMYLWSKIINSCNFTVSGAVAKLQKDWHDFFKQ